MKRAADRAYREANRGTILARQREYYKANKQKKRARDLAYREANREILRAKQRDYRKRPAVAAYNAAYASAWRMRNIEKVRGYQRRSAARAAARDRAKVNAKARARYWANVEKERARSRFRARASYQANSEKKRAQDRAYRERKKAKISDLQWTAIENAARRLARAKRKREQPAPVKRIRSKRKASK